ncbi:HWE histidine kinase domain-containing protein [Aurantimonas sp. A2-1-M11]|uniref:sensor histidine kinase n=1 Tax=Aurantimonas sp. A2-1-M11 TaxID=3113712 RepID=UPI002F93C03C
MILSRPSYTEAERLDALQAYRILDTPREEEFDDLARIASEVCGTPIAVVNFVSDTRQFFKAEVGLGVRETPVDISFCRHALLAEEMMIVPDATRDPRFDGNPLVHGEPYLRFYAGVLVKSAEGLPLGTMCVLDHMPRELDDHQIRTLRLLARQVSTQLELRLSLQQTQNALSHVRRLESQYRQIVDSAVDFSIITTDLDGTITSWSPGAQKIFGWSEAETLGQPAAMVFTAADRESDLAGREMASARETGCRIGEGWHQRKDGTRFWASGEIMPLLGEAETRIGYLKILRDRTHEYQAEEQRRELTHELSHRMKNVLATVQSIVSQSLRTAKSLDAGREAISSRVQALARAQDILTQTSWTGAGIRQVVDEALAPHRTGQGRISIDGPDVVLSAQQVLGLSLALHELATNAAKYGSLSSPSGEVEIRWEVGTGDAFRFAWIESNGPLVGEPTRRGFGSRLIERIVGSYFEGDGQLDFPPSGVTFQLTGTLG